VIAPADSVMHICILLLEIWFVVENHLPSFIFFKKKKV
jgi:hypothetical protein